MFEVFGNIGIIVILLSDVNNKSAVFLFGSIIPVRVSAKIPAEALPWQISLHMNCIMFSGKQSSAGIAFYASRSRLKISLKTLRTKGWMKNSCVK